MRAQPRSLVRLGMALGLPTALVPLEVAASSSRQVRIEWDGQFYPDVGILGWGGAGFGWYDNEVISAPGLEAFHGDLILDSTSPMLMGRELVFIARGCQLYGGTTYCQPQGSGVSLTGKLPLSFHPKVAAGDTQFDGLVLTVMPTPLAGNTLTTIEDFHVAGTLTLVASH